MELYLLIYLINVLPSLSFLSTNNIILNNLNKHVKITHSPHILSKKLTNINKVLNNLILEIIFVILFPILYDAKDSGTKLRNEINILDFIKVI